MDNNNNKKMHLVVTRRQWVIKLYKIGFSIF